jgi:hypothetical protein
MPNDFDLANHLQILESHKKDRITPVDIQNGTSHIEKKRARKAFTALPYITFKYRYICQTIIKYLDPENSNNYDNHQIPQYKYISDNEGKLIDKIFIMSQESLTQDMISLGFKDFDIKALENKNKEVDYFDFLNKRSINLINDYYAKDFELFGYKTFEFYTENELNAPP